MAILKRKELKANDNTFNVVCGLHGNGSVAFLADLPKNAVVIDVLVDGKSLKNYRLDEFRKNGQRDDVHFPRNETFEEQTVAAVYVDETCSGEMYNLVFSNSFKTFEIDYILTAIASV